MTDTQKGILLEQKIKKAKMNENECEQWQSNILIISIINLSITSVAIIGLIIQSLLITTIKVATETDNYKLLHYYIILHTEKY